MSTSGNGLRQLPQARPSPWPKTASPAPLSRRFASTAPNAPNTPLPDFTPETTTPPDTPPLPDSYADAAATASDFTPYIGFLRDAGLDFGVGPSSLMQFVLEHIHVYSGLPWFGTLAATALLTRALFFWPILASSDMAARMATLAPRLAPIQAKLKAAQARRDAVGTQAAGYELQAAYKASGVSVLKMFGPVALQAPIGFGAFRLLRNLALHNVPGLEDGGLLWFADLSVRDPYLALPAVTSFMLYYTLKVRRPPLLPLKSTGAKYVRVNLISLRLQKGGEMGTTTGQSQTMMLWLRRILPAAAFLVTYKQAAAMQLYFFVVSLLAYVQNQLIRRPGFRRFFDLQPFPPQKKPAHDDVKIAIIPIKGDSGTEGGAAAARKSSFDVSGLAKQAREWFGKAAQKREADGGRLTRSAREAAKKYEQRRREEIEEEKWRNTRDR